MCKIDFSADTQVADVTHSSQLRDWAKNFHISIRYLYPPNRLYRTDGPIVKRKKGWESFSWYTPFSLTKEWPSYEIFDIKSTEFCGRLAENPKRLYMRLSYPILFNHEVYWQTGNNQLLYKDYDPRTTWVSGRLNG